MQDANHRETWHPYSEEDLDAVRSALAEILKSDLFRGSRRYPAMLSYIVEQTLQGHQDSLKERTIGIEVFGRDPGYDTNDDPVVRFSAGEIRKRVAQFYRNSESSRTVEFHLPTGSYVPQFIHKVEPIEPAELAVEISSPQATADTDLAARPNPETKRIFPRIAFAVLLAIVLAGVMIALMRRSQNQNPVIDAWSPLLANQNSVLICTGRPGSRSYEAPEPSDINIEDHILRPEFRVSITTAEAIANIAGFLHLQKKPFRIRDAASTPLGDLHGSPVVLVNANDNKWTLLLLKSLRFQFVSEGGISYIQDSKQPAFRGWAVDFKMPFHRQTTDYAVVARFDNATTGGPVIVVAGISSNGTEAASEFIVSPEKLSELMRSAPAGWNQRNFEAVLKVEVVDGNTGASTVVAGQFW